MDRPANMAARSAGMAGTKYRVGTVRSATTQLFSRDAPDGGVVRVEQRAGKEVEVPISILGQPPRPEIQQMMTDVARLVQSDVSPDVDRDAETLEKLRALGYVE